VINETELASRIKARRPSFFGSPRHGIARSGITEVWRLPAGRALFIREDHRVPGEPHAPFTVHYLFNVDLDLVVPTQVADRIGYDGAEAATIAAIEWMQGLRSEDLKLFDKHMLHWLGEMAYRMPPEHLETFQGEYFAIPPDEWGTHENPDDRPGERLTDLLISMGYSDEYLALHLN